MGRVTAAAEHPRPVAAELRVAVAASGLLGLLDERGLTERLPWDARAAAGRLRDAVRLAVLAATADPAPAAPVARVDAGQAMRAWIRAQPWAQPDPGPPGWVYLLCFTDPATGTHRPYQGKGTGGQYAGHYWGWTTDLVRRVTREHANPRWRGPGRLVRVALAAGLSFELAYVEWPATAAREHQLKNQGGAYRRCPLCRGTGGPLDPAELAAAAAVQATGDAEFGARLAAARHARLAREADAYGLFTRDGDLGGDAA